MRAITGAILAAGAFIGLGLTAIGIGTRYAGANRFDTNNNLQWWHFRDIDESLMIIMVVLILAALVGIGITFVGLMYHHERRHNEMLHLKNQPHNGHTAPRIQV